MNKNSEIDARVASFIKLCLNEIGIRVNIAPAPFEEISKRYYQNLEFDTVLTELRGAEENAGQFFELWSPALNGKSIAGGFDSPEVTRRVSSLLKTKDKNQRKALLYEVEAQINALQPGTFLSQKTAIDAMSRRFFLPVPFSIDLSGIYRLRWAKLQSAGNRTDESD